MTAVDINPVAWFILKCTLEYPQKLAGQKLPLLDFALADEAFMAQFRKAHGSAQEKPKGRKPRVVDPRNCTVRGARVQ